MPARLSRPSRIVLPLLLLIAAAVALGLRGWALGEAPFWLDEAYSAYAADHGWRFLWHVVPAYETHPPVYYSIVHLWSGLFGETVIARRLLGLVAGLAAWGVAVLAADRLARLLGMRARDRAWLTAAAALLVAVQPLAVEMSRQVRPYPVMTLVYALGLLALVRLARDTADRAHFDRRALVLLLACEAAMCWLHSLGPLYGAALGGSLAIVALRPGLARRDWAWLLLGQIAVAIVYLPGALILKDQSSTWIAATWLKFRPAEVGAQIGWIYASWNLYARLLAGAFALTGLFLLLLEPRGRRIAAALALCATLPVTAALAVSYAITPVFLVRTLAPCAIPALLLMARGLVLPRWGRWLALLPFLALLGLLAQRSLAVARAGPMQDWYGTVRWVAARFGPGDAIWSYPNEAALPFDYAARDLGLASRLSVRPIPVAVPAIGAGGYYPTGSRGVVSLYPREIAVLVADPAACRPRTLWLLRMGAWSYDPGDRLLRALEHDRTIVARAHWGPTEIIGLRRATACAISGRAAPRAAAAAR